MYNTIKDIRNNTTTKDVIAMSILYEYETIRRRIGERKYNQIQDFLNRHKHYCLADVYYKKNVWDEMEEWIKNNNKE